jgi:hypothetical protein
LGEVVSATQVNVKQGIYIFNKTSKYIWILASMAVQLQAPPKKISTIEAPALTANE